MISLPKNLKKFLKPLYNIIQLTKFNALDAIDNMMGRKDPLIPPRRMIFIGDGDYKKIGEEFLNYFVELGSLLPNHKVLDVGCGIGRMALPLTKYLSSKGEYCGFDIVEDGINWCNNNFTSAYPNFHFMHSDIYNKTYNPNGKELSSNYNFKYENDFFDFVFLTSVFTHMETNDVKKYLEEISRVTKKNGTCLITFFLINEVSDMLINEKKSTRNLIYPIDQYSRALSKEVPEHAIGFNEDFIKELYGKNNFSIEKILYGSWCGREQFRSYQDIIIARKN